MSINDALPANHKSLDTEETEKKKEAKIEDKVADSQRRSITDLSDIADAVKSNDASCNAITTTKDNNKELCAAVPVTLQERFVRIKQRVKNAIAAHHTFMIYGRSRVIRECMLQRGWCEKFYRKLNNADPHGTNIALEQHMNVDSNPMALLAGIGDLIDEQSERQLISKMLSNHTVDFLWNSGSEWPGWPAQDNKTTVFNRFCRAGFTSKVGLCSNVRQMHWYYEAGVANTLFPRCYNICQSDQMHAFVEDFRFTACLSLLKWLVEKINTEGENATRSPDGTIPLKALDFAIRRCSDYIGAQSHEDIDQEVERIWSQQWDQFIGWYYKIVQGQAVFIKNNVPFHKYILASRHILKRIQEYWPQLNMDGIMNVWILKPGNKSRGRGITLINKLENVVAKFNPMNKSDTRYVVQKYIERPFLIYNTKFDIRQWFIVTCAQPLTFWMYRESYLRFCSQNFQLTDLHESIHLCNHAIQCKYKNSSDRDPALPAENMWDATTFKQFLKSQGQNDAWDELIYPGMKQSLVGSLLASQEAMDRRKNSFELYGADFMVMEDFSVWLIEINSHPDMSCTTSVTTRLCRQVMEDTIKVVIDFREDKTADTGQFELAYRQRMPSCQPYFGAALSLQGTRITSYEKKSSTNIQDSKLSLVSKSPMTCLSKKKLTVNSHIGPVIVDLIEELEIQLDQEFYTYYNMESPKIKQSLPITGPSESSKMSLSPDQSESNTKNITVVTSLTHPKAKATSASITSNNLTKTLTDSKSPTQKMLRKGRTSVANASHIKSNDSSNQQNVISKIVKHRQSSNDITVPKSEKVAQIEKNEEKIISMAMRDAVYKYKRNETIPSNSPPLSTLLTSNNKVNKVIHVSSAKNKNKSKNKSCQRKQSQQKKNKVLLDITDMYAVGLGLTK